ncbi:uncharacterized protein KY384_002723 [Bacidia gigantensis]|uniref:uncharacterized protein n=1 Tax=Bacidia gigantensis TaxID=2732470 RepID=UPI001D04294A|nr:uncharacterized protein KY384_002723 [Bacidia gigantensis]KAG8532845.1 hypothetical protein KY384_002723 [Bacidia gigantensis]
MPCTFQGSADVFGVGIRVGYYTQVLAVWFANYFDHGPVAGLRAVNNLFLLALICAGFTYFVNAAHTEVIEAFLLLQVGLGVALVGIIEAGRSGKKYAQMSSERLIIRIVIMIFGAVFNAFFWWKAIDIMKATPCNGSAKNGVGTYVWYGWRVNLYGWARIVMKAQSLFAALWTAPIWISQDLRVLLFNAKTRKAKSRFIEATRALRKDRKFESRIDIAEDTELRLKGDLAEVEKASDYLSSVFSIYTSSSKVQTSGLFSKFKIQKVPRQADCTDTTPYLQCLRRYFLANFDRKTYYRRCVIATHSHRLGQNTALRWPRTVNNMYKLDSEIENQCSKLDSIPDWRYLRIASDLQHAHQTNTKAATIWILEAAVQLLFIAVLIVQVEMTLVWNNVTGLNSLSSLGQLIPFILGVGGLGKVLWAKVTQLRKGDIVERQNNNPYEIALTEYNAGIGSSNPQIKKSKLQRVATV